jgi:hypothetical protein
MRRSISSRSVLLAALHAALAAWGCEAAAPIVAGEPQPVSPTLSSDPLALVLQLVDTISELPEWNKAALERVLGVTLVHTTTEPAEYLYYDVQLPSGPFEKLELRESSSTQPSFALVILDVRSGVTVLDADLRKVGRLTPDMVLDVNPHVLPEGRVTHSRRTGNQRLSYQFTAQSERLTGVSFERRPAR